jgi:putative FmdB family regulatory protein
MRYLFQCKECKKEFEVAISWKYLDMSQIYCPDCNSNNIVRKWNVPSVIYKDDGYTKKIKMEKSKE